MILPPQSVDNGTLFRKLLELRPSLPVSWRFSAAYDVELTARACSQAGWAEFMRTRDVSHVIAESLHTEDGERVFKTPREAGLLTQAEFLEMARAVMGTLAIINPTVRRIDWHAWERALVEGARINGFESEQLSACVDMSIGMAGHSTVPRPDRYWGVPFSQLLDGHWLLFWASRKCHSQ